MADVFTVSSGEAAAIQQHYEQIIEALLRTLLDTKQDNNNNNKELKIFDGDIIVYIRDNNQFRDDVSGLSGRLLNPQLIAELQQLRSCPEGGVVEGATNKRVELDGRVLLQSDEHGRVIVNTLLQPKAVQTTSSQQTSDVRQEGLQADSNPSTTNGTTRVMQSLQVLEDSPLKRLLTAEIQQLRSEVKALQQQRSLYRELVEKRLQKPQSTSWWQQAMNNVSIVVSSVGSAIKMGMREFKEHSTQHRGAASLKTLFHLHTQPGAREYQADGYQISREGSLYEVKESATGKLLMQFRSTPLGVKVETGKLEPTHIKHIDALQHSLKRNELLPTSFAPVGKQEAEYFARLEKITSALEQYAIAQQKDVEIDGIFSYKWQATPDGKVRIDAKDGRGTLLEKAGGQLKSSMSERDLIYFEQMLPKLQRSNQQKQGVTAFQSQKVKSKELER